MNPLLQKDQAFRPDLFIWNGAIPDERLRTWVRERRLELPDELMQLWRDTGGGELFESEVILGPLGNRTLGDDVDSVNEVHRGRGMDPRYLVVHMGSVLTAIRLSDKKWVVIDQGTYHELEEYDSLDAWYRAVVRSEFADRYGLPPA